MRYKLLCLVLLLEMLVVSTPILRATDLRGGVVGLAGPLVGVGVALFEVKPNKRFHLVRQTVTAPDGKYHFTKVHSGQYVLRIGGNQLPARSARNRTARHSSYYSTASLNQDRAHAQN